MPAQHPAEAQLSALRQRVPRIWATVDDMRAQRGRKLPLWAEWCFLPIAGGLAIASAAGGRRQPTVADAGLASKIAALAAWRPAKGIYRFDPALLAALRDSPLDPDKPIPREVLHRLPEWAPFIEVNDAKTKLAGFWVHLEHDVNTGRQELRFLLLGASGATTTLMMHLPDDRPTVNAGIQDALAEASLQAAMRGLPGVPGPQLDQLVARQAQTLSELLPLVLYLCTQNADVSGPREWPPPLPKPKPAKKRRPPRTHAAQAVATWDVGLRIGAALRARPAPAERGEEGGAGTSRGPMRPHARRAHWRTYWTGPGRKVPVLRWISLVVVGSAEGQIPTVRPVE